MSTTTTGMSNNGSSTCAVELQPIPPAAGQQPSNIQTDAASLQSLGQRLGSGHGQDDDKNETLPSPTTASEVIQKWNYPRINAYRTSSAFFSFLIMGANDAAYGPMIPYLEKYYDLSYTVVSLIFLSPFVGYVLSAGLNNFIHIKFGQRGIAILGPLCHTLAYVVIAVHPPYPALIVIFVLAGFGNGIEDAGWNAWVGNMSNANEVLGFLHGFYGLGATLSPLIATAITASAGLPWYTFYYVMLGGAVIELITSSLAFWKADAATYRLENPRTSDAKGNRMKEALATWPAARVTWLCAFFLLGYVGLEVAIGGWIVVFMQRVRDGTSFDSGMVATGFWLGMTLGRVVLGFVTPRLGEKRALSIYLPLCMGLELLFWLVPQFYVSAVAVGLLGFFLGPMFPGAVVATTKLLPKHLHVGAVGFASAFGGSGGAIFPFAVGALAQAKGVEVLQPFALALLVMILGMWLALPRMGKKQE